MERLPKCGKHSIDSRHFVEGMETTPQIIRRDESLDLAVIRTVAKLVQSGEEISNYLFF